MLYVIILVLVILLWGLGLEILGDRILPHSLTLRELLISIICSFTPIILDSLIQAWFTQLTLTDAFFKSFEQGQVFLYASAYLGSFFVFYVKGNSKPPGFILSIFLYSWLAGAILYTFAYSTKVLSLKSYAPQNVITAIEISVVICVFIAWYWSTLPSNKKASSGAKVAQLQQDELEKNYNSQRQGNL